MEKTFSVSCSTLFFQFVKVTLTIRSFLWLLISKSSLTWMGLDWGGCYSWQVSYKKCWKLYKFVRVSLSCSNTIGLAHGLLGLIILSKLALKDWDFRNMNYLTEYHADLTCRSRDNRYSWVNIQLFTHWSYSHFSQFGGNWLAHALSFIALNLCGVHDLLRDNKTVFGFFNHIFQRLCILYANWKALHL